MAQYIWCNMFLPLKVAKTITKTELDETERTWNDGNKLVIL